MQRITLEASAHFDPAGLVVALGFFDGMHTAHAELLGRAVTVARESGRRAAVYTFSTHVVSHMRREPFRFLTSTEEKAAFAERLGFDAFVVFKVDDELVGLEPEVFIERFLAGCAAVVVGFDFSFGRFGRGNPALLARDGRFAVTVVDEIDYAGAKIGSTRVREALAAGDPRLVQQLLGHPYTIVGAVVRGLGRGMILGFPTANVEYDGYFLPREGVYATRVRIGGEWYESMTNIGDNPTFAGKRVTLEVNVFGFRGSLYGERIAVAFLAFLRPEERFATTAELIQRMRLDEAEIRLGFARKEW